MKKNKGLLVRKESFGGTLFDVSTGKRAYIDQEEFSFTRENSRIPTSLSEELGLSCFYCSIVEPSWIPDFGFSSPDTVFFEVTRMCNLGCSHCFNNSGKVIDSELTAKQQLAVISDLKKTGVQEIRFTGGEPLLLPHVYELLSLSSSFGLRNSLGTNATLVDDLSAKRLFDSGLDMAIVSLDGTEKAHDIIRGKGSFKRAMGGISSLLRQGICVRVNAVVTKSNMVDVVELVRLCYQLMIPIFIRRLIPAGRASNGASEMLNRDDYNWLEKQIRPYLEDSRNLVQGHHLNKNQHRATPRITLPFSRSDCSAGTRGMVILPSGHIQTCGFLGPLGENPVGRVPHEPFSQIWHRLLNSDHIQNLESNLSYHNSKTDGPCTNCLAIALTTKNSRKEGWV